jgi:hypothetical protein
VTFSKTWREMSRRELPTGSKRRRGDLYPTELRARARISYILSVSDYNPAP